MLLLFYLGCPGPGGQLSIRPLAGEDEMVLEIVCNPAQADVRIDGIWQGSCATIESRRLKLPAGRHQIEISAPGFVTYSGMVEAQGMLQQLSVKLEPWTSGL